MNIELTSFLDNRQNTWFRGKDIAKILGYTNVRKAIWIHVDSEDYPKWGRWLQVAVCALILMNLDSIPLHYPLNWNLQKSSNIG